MTVTRSIFHHFMPLRIFMLRILRILRIFMLRILRILSICLFKKVSSWKVKVKVRRMLQYMELWHTITGLTNSISRKRETEIPLIYVVIQWILSSNPGKERIEASSCFSPKICFCPILHCVRPTPLLGSNS